MRRLQVVVAPNLNAKKNIANVSLEVNNVQKNAIVKNVRMVNQAKRKQYPDSQDIYKDKFKNNDFDGY